MCGIAGIINFDFPEDVTHLLGNMLGMIRHRGPDSFGIYKNKSGGLGSARLSIIDLNTGDQPIHNEDETVWVVLNGEIFNYPELRQDLEANGHRFATQTDTEVLVHLYEDHGAEFLNLLNGQFAFAIWDEQKEALLLGRDRVGIHPLFYHENKGRLVFGSEIKALFMDEKVPRCPDYQSLSDIFTCWSPLGASTAFKDVRQLLPGHYAVFSRKGMTIHQYWGLTYNDHNPAKRSLSDWMEELEALLHDSTRIRLRADVPVGSYLSGGLDSTFITSIVKNQFNNKLHTFSVSFTDDRFDEAPFQEKAVDALKTDHRSIRCTEQDIGEIFKEIIWHTEMPLLRTAPAPLFLLSRLVRESGYKVVLTGEGADEFFAGYNIFKEDRVRRFWAKDPDSKIRPRLIERLYPYIFAQGNSKTSKFLVEFFGRRLNEVDSPAYSHMLRWENTSHLKTFFSDDLQNNTDKGIDHFVERFLSMLPKDFMSWDPLSRAQYTEASVFLPNYLLCSQGDRMTMGNSVEGRFPFLDHRVIDFAGRLPPGYRLNGLTEKYILKQTAKKFIPRELADRPKHPYRAPISQCFLGERQPDYVSDMLSDEAIKKSGYFEPGRVSHLMAKCGRQKGNLLSERENMAIVGILSTQLLDDLFIKNFSVRQVMAPDNIRIFTQRELTT
jgi:asparagine synthase (glutamine-hydrolysing)